MIRTRPSLRVLRAVFASGLVFLALPGCGKPTPWQGITPQRLAALEGHRARGLKLLEANDCMGAAREFAAIQEEQPGLAFGPVNRAVALLRTTHHRAALKAAEAGVAAAPGQPWPKVVLARAQAANGQQDEAIDTLEGAGRLAPNSPRVLGELVKQLEARSTERSLRLDDWQWHLSRAAPNNLAAQVRALEAEANEARTEDVEKTLNRIIQLDPHLPPEARAPIAGLRKAIAAENSGGKELSYQLAGILKNTLDCFRAERELFGKDEDPADLAMREWDTPPPVIGPR